jgi:hypothetical protein
MKYLTSKAPFLGYSSLTNIALILEGFSAIEDIAASSQQSPISPYLMAFGETPFLPQREGLADPP